MENRRVVFENCKSLNADTKRNIKAINYWRNRIATEKQFFAKALYKLLARACLESTIQDRK